MTAEEIYHLMKALQGQLEIILKREEPITRAELVGFVKEIRAQPVSAPDPVKLAQQLMPQLMAQLPKQLPMKIEPKTEEVAKLLSPLVNEQVTAITATNERLLVGLTQHLATSDATLAARLKDLEARDASFQKTTDRIPRRVEVDFVRGWLNLAYVALGPLLIVLAILGMIGTFSKDPVANYNRVFQAYVDCRARSISLARANDSLRQEGFAQRKELIFYRNQLRQHRKKFPKFAAGLPVYSPAKK
ncbi:hypothetical protein [Hymenobacter coccineus]|uniref:Uncharacterized protein n=1 Tax=Hymenobacter coccineus TaxID=1908235 RepID=A0A1G1TH04_9BACT|nr:hypothetical protein [Hymenobacter coccineus]OGX90157.1 hypothetical protein BEN49_07315 [Hymenobacter coccineus]